jgi:hypothetical protein
MGQGEGHGMSIEESLDEGAVESVLDGPLEESGNTWSGDQDCEYEPTLLRECENTYFILLRLSLGPVDAKGIVDTGEEVGIGECGMSASCGADFGVVSEHCRIQHRIFRIATARPTTVAGLIAKKRVIETYLDICENTDDLVVQLARGLCEDLGRSISTPKL